METFGKRRPGLKGQAMMEYLMSYGLALFVILLVLAILVAVVLPSLQAPETCQFKEPGFSCNQKPHAIVADTSNNVKIIFQLDNTQGKPIKVWDVICTTKATGNIAKTDFDPLATALPMPAGSNRIFGSGVDTVECVNENGGAVNMAPNSNFRGSVAVLYNFDDDLGPSRVAVASVTGSVQAQ